MVRRAMTFDEMLKQAGKRTRRKTSSDEEHKLQTSCVRWFGIRYPDLKGRLFAVPNGGRRDKATGARLRDEGVIAGVSDLILLKSNRRYGALLIEMKGEKGRQSESQKWWQSVVCSEGEYKYVTCRSFDGFVNEVTDYLEDL